MEWLDELAEPLLGLAPQAELLKYLRTHQVRHLVRRGLLVPVHPGVYRVAGAPVTWEQEQLAGQLYLGDNAYTARRSAARLWNLPKITAVRHAYVSTRLWACERAGLVVHRSTLLPLHHTTKLGPHRVTTPARTLADLSAALRPDRLGEIIDECDRYGLCKPADVQKVRQELTARGRRRTTFIDMALEGRLEGTGPGDSELVDQVLSWIRSSRLPAPEVNLWVTVRGERYCLDIAWKDPKVCVECDGFDNHKMRHRFDGDRNKLSELALGGWLPIPVTSRMQRHTVIRRIRDALAQRTP